MRTWDQTKSSNRRIIFSNIIIILVAIGIIYRLGFWQIQRAESLVQEATPQWSLRIAMQPRRGQILDAKGRVMALNVNADTIAAIPAQIVDPSSAASALAPILNMQYDTIYTRLTSKSSQVYLKRMVSDEVSEQVHELNLMGIITIKESKRYYPNGSLAAQVLGFSGIDEGWYGLELYYEDSLQGQRGVLDFGVEETSSKEVSYTKPVDGDTLKLTLDLNVQSIVESHLNRAREQYKAESVMAIALNVKTGGVVASASVPSFDPNEYQAYSQELWRNPLVSDSFEPGSTFKIITIAAAIEEGLVDESDRFTCEGSIRVADRTIHCWNRQGHGVLDYYQIMQSSCNVGFIEIGQRIGAEKLYNYVNLFGFTERTNIDLPGEAKGIMFARNRFGPVELATTAFGQGPAVTPVQQIAAISAIGNNGLMIKPYVVDEIVSSSGELIYKHEIESYRVISEDTAKLVRKIMESVVTDGTGHRAYVEGYRVGGKTGTAQVALPQGGYDKDKFISSFIGFAPSDDPEIALFVAIKNPTSNPIGISGGIIAAPLFGDIMKDILRYLEVPTQITSVQKGINDVFEMPDLTGKTGDVAAAQLWSLGLTMEREGPASGKVIMQTPKAGVEVYPKDVVFIKTDPEGIDQTIDVEVPNLVGMSMRDASFLLGESGLRVEIKGSGIVENQFPAPGEVVRTHTIVTIELKPRGVSGE
jgi:stage V sporulation protein D (sporulation-specific penicillin-binding protein)